MWNYKTLFEYVEKKYGYDWIFTNDFYKYNTIKFVNESSNDQYIRFRLKEDKSISIYNSKNKKSKTLFQHNFIKPRTLNFSIEQRKVNFFLSLCDPDNSKLVLSIFLDAHGFYLEKVLAKDEKFIKKLESTKRDFDKRYRRIMERVN